MEFHFNFCISSNYRLIFIQKIMGRADLVFLFFYFFELSMDSVRKLEGRAENIFLQKRYSSPTSVGGSIDHRKNLAWPNTLLQEIE